ncbi:MAG: hypothetical protein AAGE52_21710, partial [Myxococcota bacterium]
MIRLLNSFLLLFVLVCACGDSEDPPVLATGAAPDLSCLGVRSAPMGGETTLVTRPVVPFGAPPTVTIPGVPVRFFLGDRVTATCELPDCIMTLSDDTGMASAELPAGAWVVTEVPEIPGPDAARSLMRTIESQWIAGDEETINTFSRGTLADFESVLGFAVDPARGIVSGRILDCQDRPLENVEVRWFDDDREIAGDSIYFNGALPPALDIERDRSASDGRYAGILPPEVSRVEAWGVVDGETVRIACEDVQVEPDSLSVLVLKPT